MSVQTGAADRARGGPISRLYRGQTNFDFINRWKYWFGASGLVIAIGLIALGVGGLNFSIDFRGGTVWQVQTDASVATVRAEVGSLGHGLSQATITQLTNRQTGKKNIQVEAPSKVTSDINVVESVTSELARIGHVPKQDVNINAIGPSWGSSITGKAVEAVIVFLVLISLAISIYFESKMAIAALVALVHDMLITVGIYALSGFQVSPDTVIAFLTVLGYSLYDTIVVFDKVKENTKGLASTNRATYTDVVNLSMNQVLARSVNTSFVAIMPVFCILVIGAWLMGATALNDFGLALFIGLMSGAYSSIFIASPILAILKEREPRYVEIRRRLAAYPQSRQILTPETVADGILVAPRNAGRALGTTASGGGGRLLAAEGPVGLEEVGLMAGSAGAVSGATRTGGDGGGVVGGAGSRSGGTPTQASASAGGPEGGNAGAGTGLKPVPRRPAPPRAKRKVPRHR